MPTLDELKQIVQMVDLSDLEDAQVGDIYDIEGVAFRVSTVKPIKVSSHKFAIELSTEEGLTFRFLPVIVNTYELKDYSTFEAIREKKRKNKNKEKYMEIYEKSKTISSKQLANEYGISYQMIRYAIRRAKKLAGD